MKAARKVQLTIKSWHRSMIDCEQEGTTSMDCDQALSSYYSYPRNETPSSYIPQRAPDDWILDGRHEWKNDAKESENLLKELRESSDFEVLLQQMEQNRPLKDNDEEDSDDESSFEEFQSAENRSPSPLRHITPNSNVYTPELVRKLDSGEDTEEDLHQFSSTTDDLELIQDNPDRPVLDSPPTTRFQAIHSQAIHSQSSPRDVTTPTKPTASKPAYMSPSTDHLGPVSLQLSLEEHLKDPVARMTRRRQQQQQNPQGKTPTQAEVPLQYFSDGAAAVKDLLTLPWESDDSHTWEVCITKKLSQLDEALACINEQLAMKDTNVHQGRLQKVHDMIHDTTAEVSTAMGHLEFLQTKLLSAQGDGVVGITGYEQLIRTWQEREERRQLARLCSRIAELYDKEQHLWRLIEEFDPTSAEALARYDQAVSLKDNLFNDFSDDSLLRIEALHESRDRLCFVPRYLFSKVCEALEVLIATQCSKSAVDWPSFDSILHVGIDLMKRADQKSRDVFLDDLLKSIMSSFEYEMNRCFALALVEGSGGTESAYKNDVDVLLLSLMDDRRDLTKLRTVTHNLVTIRCDFEADERLFPKIFWKTVVYLHECLRAFDGLVSYLSDFEFRRDTREDEKKETESCTELQKVVHQLETSRPRVWKIFEGVLEYSLREYKDFSGQKPLFDAKSGGAEDLEWARDLQDLQCITVIVDQLHSFSSRFVTAVEENPVESEGTQSIDSVLEELSRKHLRAVHVNTVNSLGRALFDEQWNLGKTFSIATTINKSLQKHQLQKTTFTPLSMISANETEDRTGENPLSGIQSEQLMYCLTEASESRWQRILDTIDYEFEGCWSRPSTSSPRYMLACFNELYVCISRLLQVAEMLPSVRKSGQLSEVFIDVFDLYILTVFRLCCGDEEAEMNLLSVSEVIEKENSQHNLPISPRSEAMQVKRKVASNAQISANNLLSRESDIDSFLQRARERLNKVVRLEKVNTWLPDDTMDERVSIDNFVRRMTASLSLYSILETSFMISTLLPDLTAFGEYSETFAAICPLVIDLSCRISCAKALALDRSVSAMTHRPSLWEQCVLHEQANKYVDELCGRFDSIVEVMEKKDMPHLEHAWQLLVRVACEALLEGFSRIQRCSTEGRALMALDLASLRAGMTSDAPVRNELVQEVREHFRRVDTYIKVHYLSKEDILKWIMENYRSYKIDQCVALFDTESEEDWKDIAFIRALYRESN